jgi:hypothetical protein
MKREAKAGAKPKRTAKPAAPEEQAANPATPTRREPRADEIAAIAVARERYEELPARVQITKTVDDRGVHNIEAPHNDPGGHTALLALTFGSSCHPFIDNALKQVLGAAGERGQAATEAQANAALAFIGAVGPADEMEASMAVQMYATNALAMEMLSRARHSKNQEHTREYTNLATKLSRTFVAMVEGLSKLRRGGEQVVKYIHVHEGGQAVVAGTINQGGGANAKGLEQSHAPRAGALRSPDPARDLVPLAADAERAVPDARRDQSGSAEGQ